MEDQLQEFYKEMEGKKLVDLVGVMNVMRIELDAATAIKTELQAKYDALRLNIVPSAMDNDGVSNITVEGIGRVGLTPDIYASIADKEEAYKWLRENQHGDIIKDTINAGTLKATLKEILKKGTGLPPDGIFKITPFTRASITKK
jgi:hypothetical protein